jgi:rhodanese-related sulfurtransferase
VSGGAAVLLDVRGQAEWNRDHVDGALHIPLSRLKRRLAELPRDTTLITACRSGHRSAIAARMLARAGYHAVNLRGGLGTWERASERT